MKRHGLLAAAMLLASATSANAALRIAEFRGIADGFFYYDFTRRHFSGATFNGYIVFDSTAGLNYNQSGYVGKTGGDYWGAATTILQAHFWLKGYHMDFNTDEFYSVVAANPALGSEQFISEENGFTEGVVGLTATGISGLTGIETTYTTHEGFGSAYLETSGSPFREPWGAFADDIRLTSVSVSAFDPTRTLGAVPEPATWAMMIMGFGATGALLRRRDGGQATSRAA